MTPNPRHWARELWQRSRDRGLQTHIDVLVDATGLDDYPLLAEHARQSDPPALFKLLEQTPEAALADEGPLLLRLEDGHAAWLDELLERIDCRRHLMLLFSPWPLPRLGEHLRSCTQAEWNQGRSSGVLRFYEPGLFMAVSDMLDPRQSRYLHAPVSSWHWLDRDGRPREQAGHYQAHETPPLQAALRLEAHQVAALRAWSEAEAYRREYFVLPREHGLGSQESLLQHLVQAHLAADRQSLQDFGQRDAFVAQWLREQTPGPGFSRRERVAHERARHRPSPLLPGPLLAAGCQSGPDMLAAPVMGSNHTSAAINWFSVNGAGGPRLGPYQGDGSQVCCGVIPKKWNPNLKAVVEWEKDPKPHAAIRRHKYGRLDKDDYLRHASSYNRHKMIVDIPRYSEKICLLQVHFLPCDQVAVSTTYYSQGHPEYPDRKYFQKREPSCKSS